MKFAILILLFTSAYSHPHTFIEVEPTIEIKDQKMKKLHVRWILDEMTSMMLIMELDINGDGKFDDEENDYINDNYFASLANYNFYTQIVSGDKKLIIDPKNFQASIKNDRLVYAFDIIQNIDTKDLKIKFADESLFVGMVLEKDYITLKGVKKENMNKTKKTIFGID